MKFVVVGLLVSVGDRIERVLRIKQGFWFYSPSWNLLRF